MRALRGGVALSLNPYSQQLTPDKTCLGVRELFGLEKVGSNHDGAGLLEGNVLSSCGSEPTRLRALIC